MNATQVATIARLNRLTTCDWFVDAGSLATEATEPCANDSDHGPGTCYLPGVDGLCPTCTIDYLTTILEAGASIAVDVLRSDG